MALFDRYSPGARRAIFFAAHFAREHASGYIEPEHILEGVLHEDAALFRILLPTDSSGIERLKAELAAGRQKFTCDVGKMALPLSPTAKLVVLSAGDEQERLSHSSIATQHLLLALLTTSSTKAGWFRKETPLPVQQTLVRYGITAELVEAKTKDGIVTPVTRVLDDTIIALNARLAALLELLIAKGIFTRPECAALLDSNEGPITPNNLLGPLMHALADKGILTEAEQQQLRTSPKQQSDGSAGI